MFDGVSPTGARGSVVSGLIHLEVRLDPFGTIERLMDDSFQ
jgi:hypothetical protein